MPAFVEVGHRKFNPLSVVVEECKRMVEEIEGLDVRKFGYGGQ